MTPTELIALFATYKYFILYPLAIIEGHVISLISGFLARTGFINPFIAASVIALGNLTGDVLFYFLGYYKGERFLKRWGMYVGITETTIKKSKELFLNYQRRILFFTKLTNGFGLQIPILFTAGLSKVPFKTYMFWNILGESIWTGTLVLLGYLFGALYTKVESTLWQFTCILGGVCFFFILFRIHRSLFNRNSPN